jgi:hypothetical protein
MANKPRPNSFHWRCAATTRRAPLTDARQGFRPTMRIPAEPPAIPCGNAGRCSHRSRPGRVGCGLEGRQRRDPEWRDPAQRPTVNAYVFINLSHRRGYHPRRYCEKPWLASGPVHSTILSARRSARCWCNHQVDVSHRTLAGYTCCGNDPAVILQMASVRVTERSAPYTLRRRTPA